MVKAQSAKLEKMGVRLVNFLKAQSESQKQGRGEAKARGVKKFEEAEAGEGP